MPVQPYLSFEGRCAEALDFYCDALGAQVEVLMHFKDAPAGAMQGDGCADGPAPPAGKVMHAQFRVGDSVLMATDGMCSGQADFKGISLALSVADEDQAGRHFDALGQGGQVQAPLGPTFFSKAFGMVADRFGVTWMVVAPAP